MGLEEYLPFAGNRSARSRFKELEREAGSLPIVFGVLASKVIENVIVYDPVAAARFAAASGVTGLTYIYWHHIEQAKEAVEEVVDDE